MQATLPRYLRLFAAFARYSLARELAFRGNFLAKITVELLWLGILLLFYRTIFTKTSLVAGWSENEYLFFVGCYFALEGVIETFFLENSVNFADLIRNGDLDFYLLRPIDEQFLISCRSIDWSTAPNVLLGMGVMGFALRDAAVVPSAGQAAAFVGLFAGGVALAYSFLLMLSAGAVWLTRNQSLMELWWLFTSLMRYPREIYRGGWATPLGFVFSFIIPIMLVVHVPASTMVKTLEPALAVYAAGAAVVMLVISRAFLRYALRCYRSASS